jgi:hypothetical protein
MIGVIDEVSKIFEEYKCDPPGFNQILDRFGIRDARLCPQTSPYPLWVVPEENHNSFMEYFNKKGYVKSSKRLKIF